MFEYPWVDLGIKKWAWFMHPRRSDTRMVGLIIRNQSGSLLPLDGKHNTNNKSTNCVDDGMGAKSLEFKHGELTAGIDINS